MTIIAAVRKSIAGATSSPKLVFLLYFANLLFALPAAILFRSFTATAFGNSMAADGLLPGFDNNVVSDLLSNHTEVLGSILRQVVPIAVLGIFLNIFLAGGTLDCFVHKRQFSLEAFFGACGRYFGRFLKAWLLMLVTGVIVVALLSIPFGLVVGALGDGGGNEQTVFIATIVAIMVIYSPILLLVIVADYARVSIVVHDMRSTWKAVGRGYAFVFRNFAAAIGLYMLLFVLVLVASATYWALEDMIGMSSVVTVTITFIVQQLFVVVRAWNRTSFFAGSAALYEGRKPRPVIFYGWDDSPAIETA
jgi:hypothetical protein